MQPKLTPHMSIPRAAKMAGVPYTTFKRRLVALDRELGGMLIVRFGVGNRQKLFVTIAGLRKAMPEIFDSEPLVNRIEALDRRVENLEIDLTVLKKICRELYASVQTRPDATKKRSLLMKPSAQNAA